MYLPLHMARAVHLRPFFELRLLRAYSIQPQWLKLSLKSLKKISEATEKTLPECTLLLKRAALLHLIFDVIAGSKVTNRSFSSLVAQQIQEMEMVRQKVYQLEQQQLQIKAK